MPITEAEAKEIGDTFAKLAQANSWMVGIWTIDDHGQMTLFQHLHRFPTEALETAFGQITDEVRKQQGNSIKPFVMPGAR